jgi:hypothetical protein
LICATERALDTALETVLATEPRIVRVGARPPRDRLRGCTLRARGAAEQSSDEAHGRAWRALSKQQKALRDKIEALAASIQQVRRGRSLNQRSL